MRRLLLFIIVGAITTIKGGEEIKIGNDEEIAPNILSDILSEHLHGLVLQNPPQTFKLTGFNDSSQELVIPFEYIKNSKTLTDLFKDNKKYTIDIPKNANLFRSDTDIIFNKIIEKIRKEIPTRLNIHKICWKEVKSKPFYETLRLLQTINYLDMIVNKTSLTDIFCNVLKNKKIKIDEIEKCKELKIPSAILSKIAWIESSLYKSENLKISGEISLNMAINEDCSKIGVVGLTDDQGKDKITLFEKDEDGYKIRREGKLYQTRKKKKTYLPFAFINLTFRRQNDPLLYAEAFDAYYSYDLNNNVKDIEKAQILDNPLIFNKEKKLMGGYQESLTEYIIENVTNNTATKIAMPHESLDNTTSRIQDLNLNSCFDKHGNKIAIPCYHWKNSYYGLSVYTIAKKQLVNIKCAPYRIRCLALSNDGTLIAAQIENLESKKYKTCLWNAETGKLLSEISGASPLIQIMFTPQDNWLMTVPQEGPINLVNIFTKKVIDTKLAPFTTKPAIPCSSCVSLQENGNDVLLYGIFQNEKNDKECNLELYKLESAAKSDDFFLELYMNQNNIKQFNENTPLYSELKRLYDNTSHEFKQRKQIINPPIINPPIINPPIINPPIINPPTWSSWVKEKASKYWHYVATATVLGLYLRDKIIDANKRGNNKKLVNNLNKK